MAASYLDKSHKEGTPRGNQVAIVQYADKGRTFVILGPKLVCSFKKPCDMPKSVLAETVGRETTGV